MISRACGNPETTNVAISMKVDHLPFVYTLNLEWFILQILLKIVFILENCADLMKHCFFSAFHLGLQARVEYSLHDINSFFIIV